MLPLYTTTKSSNVTPGGKYVGNRMALSLYVDVYYVKSDIIYNTRKYIAYCTVITPPSIGESGVL